MDRGHGAERGELPARAEPAGGDRRLGGARRADPAAGPGRPGHLRRRGQGGRWAVGTLVHVRRGSARAGERRGSVARLVVGAASGKVSGSENSARGSNTRSAKPGATTLMGEKCREVAMPALNKISPARDE